MTRVLNSINVVIMGGSDRSKKGELFIVDNSDIAWKVQKYLAEWCELSKKFDIATGYFEIRPYDPYYTYDPNTLLTFLFLITSIELFNQLLIL
jgi:hypothetical protein